jgi:glycosyltransferase involved in cell wall biosynthesis
MKSDPRVAFVVDTLPSLGGGEKVLFTALEAYPQADIFTLVYNQDVFTCTPLANKIIKTSFINALPFAHQRHRLFLPAMPFAIERFNLKAYDLIVSFSYAVAHGVKNYNGARHVSYTYTPMRYAWTDLNLNGTRTHKNPMLDQFMKSFRNWDRKAASRVHEFAAISQAVAQRIMDAYQRPAPIIYPPVEVDRFHAASQRDNFYITISRLVPHKRLDVIVEAFSLLKLPLIVIGDGPELTRLKELASPNICFMGYQPDSKVIELLSKARGFICAAEEDFGIAIVEAQAAGCPVISYGKGGALETVVEGKTGLFFAEQDAGSLMRAVQKFEQMHCSFQPETLIHNAQRYNKPRFLREFKQFVEMKS